MKAFVAILGLVLALGFLGCEVKTGAHWAQPVVLASDLTPSAIEGMWEGSWQSYESWDNGLFHLVVVPVEEAAGMPGAATLPAIRDLPLPGTRRYLAQVRQWHWGTLCWEKYSMILVSTRGVNGQIEFHAERDLGPLNGFCKFDGLVDANKASSSYVTREDFGTVVLRRVVPLADGR